MVWSKRDYGERVIECYIFIKASEHEYLLMQEGCWFQSSCLCYSLLKLERNPKISHPFITLLKLQNDLLHSTIYDIVYEEEHQEIYNILLNPPKTAIDPQQSQPSPENQIRFLAHLKRGSLDNPPKVLYEYVQFTGYFSEFKMKRNL